METILKNSKQDTVDLLVEMIFGDMAMSEIQSICQLQEGEKRNVILERMKSICEEVRS